MSKSDATPRGVAFDAAGLSGDPLVYYDGNRVLRSVLRNKAIVLGCGPAGLFAAHGLTHNGWDVRIISRKRKSDMFGAQFLHYAIPGLSTIDDGIPITYRLRGSIDNYRRKVYGWEEVPAVSPQVIPQAISAYDIRAAYNRAWIKYSPLIEDSVITNELVSDLLADERNALVVSTIPRPQLCLNPIEHTFRAREVWAAGDAPELGITVPVRPPRNEVVCDGTNQRRWYRAANVDGYCTVEWPLRAGTVGRSKPVETAARVTKPIDTDCTCREDIIFMGRYGKWQKGYLSHHAYEEAIRL